MRNGECPMPNAELGMGNGEWGMGNSICELRPTFDGRISNWCQELGETWNLKCEKLI